MAQIDPEMHRRLVASINQFSAVCTRLRDEATLLSYSLAEAMPALDADLAASIEDATNAAIQRAKNPPAPEGAGGFSKG